MITVHRNRIQELLIVLLLCVVGCTTQPPTSIYPVPDVTEVYKKGVYHKVKRGETIWRIAKTYDVVIDDIIRSNRIPDIAQVEENQLIFIPGADSIREVILFPLLKPVEKENSNG